MVIHFYFILSMFIIFFSYRLRRRIAKNPRIINLFSLDSENASPVPLRADPNKVPIPEPTVSPIKTNPDLIGAPM